MVLVDFLRKLSHRHSCKCIKSPWPGLSLGFRSNCPSPILNPGQSLSAVLSATGLYVRPDYTTRASVDCQSLLNNIDINAIYIFKNNLSAIRVWDKSLFINVSFLNGCRLLFDRNKRNKVPMAGCRKSKISLSCRCIAQCVRNTIAIE